MNDLLARLGVTAPVVQTGLGGIPTSALAVAVAEAGGLGTISWLPLRHFRRELAAARGATDRPLAANLVVPLSSTGHWRAAQQADLLVTHWETHPRRRVSIPWLHTVGSADEARAAVAAGADGIVVQGRESGGHVRGTISAMSLLDRVLRVVPKGFPIWLAGGIAERDDVREALAAGAAAAVAGTRFVASEECHVHPGYQQRIVESKTTVLTHLFGLGWPDVPHRVLPNAATAKWLTEHDTVGPSSIRRLHKALSPFALHAPRWLQESAAHSRGLGAIDLTARAPLAGMPDHTVENSPLYAGETVARIHDVRPAAQIVADLTP